MLVDLKPETVKLLFSGVDVSSFAKVDWRFESDDTFEGINAGG